MALVLSLYSNNFPVMEPIRGARAAITVLLCAGSPPKGTETLLASETRIVNDRSLPYFSAYKPKKESTGLSFPKKQSFACLSFPESTELSLSENKTTKMKSTEP